MKNPLIVPLKILRGHEVSGGLGVMALAFHPVLVRANLSACNVLVTVLTFVVYVSL